ncbi:MAG: hypothetical protein KF781_07095 [Chitinophagaceae bacterium]|nr:hypothetical protein [Chitinophagaceae bacterium]MCW5904012.1 hypothetical protein [Chitinophagaceae bacterium]
MRVIIRCTKQQEEEILAKETLLNVEMIFTEDKDKFCHTNGDVFFDLITDESAIEIVKKDTPIFISSVLHTCKELPENCIRINGWNGFLQRNIIEIATNKHQEYVQNIMNVLGWKYQFVPDEIGMIAPRIIAMIVNEAYFALEDNVSTPEEIDTALKLGTNYPFGPFEWSNKIGLKNIYLLLQKLSLQDIRYTPSELLQSKAN